MGSRVAEPRTSLGLSAGRVVRRRRGSPGVADGRASPQMIEPAAGAEAGALLAQLAALLEQEVRGQPKAPGLRLVEGAHDTGLRVSARLRDFEVKDLLSLTQFFGLRPDTFSLAVNCLDRFLARMKVGLLGAPPLQRGHPPPPTTRFSFSRAGPCVSSAQPGCVPCP